MPGPAPRMRSTRGPPDGPSLPSSGRWRSLDWPSRSCCTPADSPSPLGAGARVDTLDGLCYNKAPFDRVSLCRGVDCAVYRLRRRWETMTLGETETTNRQRRHLTELAIQQATRREWEAAVQSNRELLELGGDTDGYNRLGKALAELGRHAEALEAYEGALTRDATNQIARRNV